MNYFVQLINIIYDTFFLLLIFAIFVNFGLSNNQFTFILIVAFLFIFIKLVLIFFGKLINILSRSSHHFLIFLLLTKVCALLYISLYTNILGIKAFYHALTGMLLTDLIIYLFSIRKRLYFRKGMRSYMKKYTKNTLNDFGFFLLTLYGLFAISILESFLLITINLSYVLSGLISLILFTDITVLSILLYKSIRKFKRLYMVSIIGYAILFALPLCAYLFISSHNFVELFIQSSWLTFKLSYMISFFSLGLIVTVPLYFCKKRLRMKEIITIASAIVLHTGLSYVLVPTYNELGVIFSFFISLTFIFIVELMRGKRINKTKIISLVKISTIAFIATSLSMLTILFYSDIAVLIKSEIIQITLEASIATISYVYYVYLLYRGHQFLTQN